MASYEFETAQGKRDGQKNQREFILERSPFKQKSFDQKNPEKTKEARAQKHQSTCLGKHVTANNINVQSDAQGRHRTIIEHW